MKTNDEAYQHFVAVRDDWRKSHSEQRAFEIAVQARLEAERAAARPAVVLSDEQIIEMAKQIGDLWGSSDDDWLIRFARAILAAQCAAPDERAQPKLTVWYGSMPESNGKSNFTAILNRADAEGLDKFDGFTIARSEYPDRVRYEADCVRALIGELPEKPWITDYDADKHSGYVAPPAPAAQPEKSPHDVCRAIERNLRDEVLRLHEVIAAQPEQQPVAYAFPDGLDRLAKVRDGYNVSPLLTVNATQENGFTVALYAAPVPAAAPEPLQGIIKAAEFIEKRAADYLDEFGDNEHDTGALVFRNGAQGREYHSTLVELADDIRALAAAPVGGA